MRFSGAYWDQGYGVRSSALNLGIQALPYHRGWVAYSNPERKPAPVACSDSRDLHRSFGSYPRTDVVC